MAVDVHMRKITQLFVFVPLCVCLRDITELNLSLILKQQNKSIKAQSLTGFKVLWKVIHVEKNFSSF